MSITIETKRLILREWQYEDADVIVDALSDGETAKNLTIPYPYTLQNANDFIKIMKEQNDLCFAVTLKENGELIGSVEPGGIWLHRDYHGKGYGTEAFTAVSKFAFDIKKVDKISSGYFHYNSASERLHKKLGFMVVGEKMTFCPTLNKNVKEIRVELTKQDFEKFYNSQNFEFKIVDEKTK